MFPTTKQWNWSATRESSPRPIGDHVSGSQSSRPASWRPCWRSIAPSPPLVWSHSLVEAYIIAAYVLYHAKRWVDGCGGNSDIFLLPNDSTTVTRLPSSEIETLESYFDDLDAALRPLLAACPTDPSNDNRFRKDLIISNQNLWAARARFQEFEQVFKRMMKEGGVDAEQMWAEVTESVDQLFKPLSQPPEPLPQDSSQSQKP